MKRFKDYFKLMTEGDERIVNKHLEHIEDEIINKGAQGVELAFSYFNQLFLTLKGETEQPMDVTLKWDGAPAIFCGKDPEDGKFFVSTKGFLGVNITVSKSIEDIKLNHADVTSKKTGKVTDMSGLRDKMYVAFNHLRKIKWDLLRKEFGSNVAMQGDLLFTKKTLRKVQIDGEERIAFKPNTISYTIPTSNDLAQEMLNSEMGIVFHTFYTGRSLPEMSAAFGSNDRVEAILNTVPDTWIKVEKPIKNLSGQINLTATETAHIQRMLDAATNLHGQLGDVYGFLNSEQCGDLVIDLKAHINAIIRERGVFEQDPAVWAKQWMERYERKAQKHIQGLKTPAGRDKRAKAMEVCVSYMMEHWEDIYNLYRLYLSLIEIKLMFVEKLNRLDHLTQTFIEEPDGSFSVTGQEGYVAINDTGNAVKFIDRLDFSKRNFAPKEPGKKFD